METDSNTKIGRAIITVLKPLLRVLIRNKITVADFSELARQAYVDVAYEHFGIPGKKLTFARIAVLTGLSRKEVVRLDKLRASQGTLTRPSPNRAQRVVNGWIGDAEFLTKKGLPRVLPLQGDRSSFAALVARYSGDITLGAVLDELIGAGVASRDSRDRIHLLSLGYIPQADELEKIQVMATCAADLLSTAVHNMEHGDVDPKFQRQVTYPSISPAQTENFRRKSAELSAIYLQELNQLLAKARDESGAEQLDGGAAESRRVGFGIYYFDGPEALVAQPDPDSPEDP